MGLAQARPNKGRWSAWSPAACTHFFSIPHAHTRAHAHTHTFRISYKKKKTCQGQSTHRVVRTHAPSHLPQNHIWCHFSLLTSLSPLSESVLSVFFVLVQRPVFPCFPLLICQSLNFFFPSFFFLRIQSFHQKENAGLHSFTLPGVLGLVHHGDCMQSLRQIHARASRSL